MEPTNSGDAETAVNTKRDAEIAMNGILRLMSSSDYYGRNFLMYGDAKGGDFTVPSAGRGLDQLYSFPHTPTNNANGAFWSHIYNCLLQVNNLVGNIEKLEAQGRTEFTAIKGQAVTLRALMYFDLVRLYGKPYNMDKDSYGVPDVATKISPSEQPLRATVAKNYERIVNDLQQGATLLSGSKAIAKGYINYYANKAIQARVYLAMENYPAALAAAEEIISDNKYTLYTNTNWLTSWKAQHQSESIFELGMFQTENDLGNSSLGVYTMRRGHINNALGNFVASSAFLNRLGEDEADIRWGIMAQDETTLPTVRKGALYKYSGSTTLEGDGKGGSYTAVNIKVIRLSEIYLIAAEAALYSDKAKAATYLNTIRKRSPNLALATSGTIDLNMVLNEKSKELFGEGHRFFDMIRTNQTIVFNDEDFGFPAGANRPNSINRTYYKTILPISDAELNANPGLRAQQNPQY